MLTRNRGNETPSLADLHDAAAGKGLNNSSIQQILGVEIFKSDSPMFNHHNILRVM